VVEKQEEHTTSPVCLLGLGPVPTSGNRASAAEGSGALDDTSRSPVQQ